MNTNISINELTSALALGAVAFLGVFLIVDHFLNLWVLFQHYSQGEIWTFTFSIPILILMYAIGLMINSISDYTFSKFNKKDIVQEVEDLYLITMKGNEAIINYYLIQVRLRSFFQGCSISFLILAIGSLLTYKWIPGQELFSFLFAFAVLCLAILCPIISKRFLKKENEMLKRVRVE